MAFLSVTEARNNLSELVSRAEQSPTVLIKDSKPAAVLLGINEYRTLAAARTIARDPARLVEIHQAHERIRAGDESDLVDLELADEGGIAVAAF
jgi:prevent-host-death family protein